MSKVDYEVRKCDCCQDFFVPGIGAYGNYELTRKGEIVDLCPKCKNNLIVYVNTHIENNEEEEEEE